ncbi:MAG: alpha/beta fold hydrolase [Betaproteobacteria bacterium]|nr:alpha/beta fold hydrolase [Betaproteobacteria bacterium]
MPYVRVDGVRLYYEEAGTGTPVVFVHEFAGDLRSWEPQLRFFARRYRCIVFNARGYPPSDVPASASKYSQAIHVDDIVGVLDALEIRKAHIVGCSMGGYAAIHFALRYARRAFSATAIGAGFGSDPDKRDQFLGDTEAQARRFDQLGMPKAVQDYKVGPSRVQYLTRDPRGFAEFAAQFEAHSARGSAHTLRGVQAKRPTVYELEKGLRTCKLPLLVVSGDEDDNCLEPGIFIKRVCMSANLLVVPATGHAVNLEEPDFFNRALLDFLTAVDTGAWRPRDPRSLGRSTLSNKG